jgi:hypothetical protein
MRRSRRPALPPPRSTLATPTHGPPPPSPTTPRSYEVLEFEPGKKLVLSGLSEHHTQLDQFIFMPDKSTSGMTVGFGGGRGWGWGGLGSRQRPTRA